MQKNRINVCFFNCFRRNKAKDDDRKNGVQDTTYRD